MLFPASLLAPFENDPYGKVRNRVNGEFTSTRRLLEESPKNPYLSEMIVSLFPFTTERSDLSAVPKHARSSGAPARSRSWS